MKGFITDASNDLMLDALGNLRIESGIEAYRQNLINSIRLQQYEYAFNLSEGLNYMGYLFGDNANLAAWEMQLFDLLKSKDFVKSIVEWETAVEGNVLAFKLVVETDLGNIEIRG